MRGSGGVVLAREHRDPATGALIQEAPLGFAAAAADLTAAVGGLSPAAFRAERLVQLRRQRDRSTDDEVQRVALDKRIADIADDVGSGIALSVLGFALRYTIALQGLPAQVLDPAGALGGTIGAAPWICDLWFGAFDADTLCTFVKGSLELPFAAA